LATWLGDNVNLTLAALLRKNGLIAENRGLFVEVHLSNGQTIDDLHLALHNLIKSEKATVQDILSDAQALRMEKWDWALPDELLMKSFASLRLEIDSAYHWIHQHFHAENGAVKIISPL
jgi:ATP-dependent Lhr-like helicase